MAQRGSTALACLLLVTACKVGDAGQNEDGEERGSVGVPTISIGWLDDGTAPGPDGGSSNEALLETIEPGDLMPYAPNDSSDICQCETLDCMRQWVRDMVGCGVCLTIIGCGDEHDRHVCVLCD